MKTLDRIKRRSCGCCLLIVLAFLALIAGLFWLAVRAARAATEGPPAREIVLAIDHSPSMWDCDGVGTDPQMLRVDAARLFVQYLGADGRAPHRLAVLHFGGEVEQVAGLTDLADPQGRARLLEAVSQARPIRWTDQRLALEAARKLLAETGTAGSRRLIVLLTDGEPAPIPRPGADVSEAGYLKKLTETAAALAQEGTTLAVVLLSDVSTSCGRAVAANWVERWAQLAEQTPGGSLYTANQADELLPIYHAIVRELAGAEGAAAAANAILRPGEPLVVPVPVDGAVAGLVITVWKAEAATTAELRDPAGRPATADHAGVTVTGGSGSREQVWRVNRPQVGLWQVVLNGRGRVSVWHDRIIATPTSTNTATNTATNTPTNTPTNTATNTPTATATNTTTPTPTNTTMPMATDTPMPPAAAGSAEQGEAAGPPRWPWALAGGAMAAGAIALIGARRRGPYLAGQLTPLDAPAEAGLLLPLDLGRPRRRRVTLGRGGQGEWRLPGWSGSIRLDADRGGNAVLVPVAGEVTVDGRPVGRPLPLADGAVIGCGAYRIRYENLLK